MNLSSKQFEYIILFVIAVIYNLIYSTSVYCSGPPGDSTIFQQMGLAIIQGKTPYVDLFDHKGILLYWLNAVGIFLLPHGIGLLALCVINIFITLIIWYKITTLYLDSWTRWIPISITLLLLAFSFGDANYTEMWCLPIISYSVLLYAKFVSNGKKTSDKGLVFIGIGIASIIFIRVNNLIPVIIVISCILLSYFNQKDFKEFWRSGLIIFLSLSLTCTSIMVFFVILYGHEHLSDMIYGTFLFNFEYAAKYGKQVNLNYGQSLFSSVFIVFSTILFLIMLLTRFGNKKKIMVLFITSELLTIMTTSKAYYDHYFFILVPIYIITMSSLLKAFCEKSKFICFVLIIIVFCSGYYVFEKTKKSGISLYSIDYPVLQEKIPQAERNQIWNYNAHSFGGNILKLNGISQSNRIILPFQCDISTKLKEKGRIEEIKPKWLMIATNAQWLNSEDSCFINNHYDSKFSIDIYPQEIVFLKAKQ